MTRQPSTTAPTSTQPDSGEQSSGESAGDATSDQLELPDAHTCLAGTQTPHGLEHDCPDCRAPADVDCTWSCSSTWN